MSPQWPVLASAIALVASGVVLLTAGVRLTRVADHLADRTGMGEALTGAVLLGATTSLPGLVTTAVGASAGDAGFAVSNSMGGIAAQTAFLALADLTYRRVNLEHAAASVPNIIQTMILVSLIGIVLGASGGPDITFASIHPATLLLVLVYAYGLVLTRRARQKPMWRPEETVETVPDVAEAEELENGSRLGRDAGHSTRSLWLQFAGLGIVVGSTGWVVGNAGLSLADRTGMSGSLVGAVFTSVITSLPELVTVLAAVRIGALTLAVGDIIGGNSFDVLFVAAADVFFRGGSVYHAADDQAVFLMALTVVLAATLAAGMLGREKRHIGFEGVGILAFYVLGVAGLIALG